MIIAIGGASCSGKTSLSLKLKDQLESFELIHQDDFYKRNEKLPVEHSTNWECWDCIESVRIDELISQLDPTKNIILEGFLLFQDQRIQKICDLMFLLHVDLDTMKSRRENRIYPLSETDHWKDPEGYIEKLVYPSYQFHHQKILNLKDIEPHRHLNDAAPQDIPQITNSNIITLDSSNNSLDQLFILMMKHIKPILK